MKPACIAHQPTTEGTIGYSRIVTVRARANHFDMLELMERADQVLSRFATMMLYAAVFIFGDTGSVRTPGSLK